MKAIFLEIFCMFGTMSASIFLYDEFLIDPTGYLIRVLGLSAPMLDIQTTATGQTKKREATYMQTAKIFTASIQYKSR